MWLPLLADAGWVRELLSDRADELGLTGAVQDVRLVDVRLTNPHRPQSPLCRGWATYVVEAGGAAPVQLYLKGFADAAVAEDAGAAGRGHLLAEQDLVVWRFPGDPRLPSLPALARPDPEILPSPVVALLGGRPEEVRSTVVRYQPEASVTLRLTGADPEGPAVFAKHLADGSIAGTAGRHEALWRSAAHEPALRVAEPLAADPVRRVLWTRAVPGLPLATAVAVEALPSVAAPVGELLAALHRSVGAPAETVAVDDLLREMQKKAGKLAVAHPDVGAAVAGIVAAAAARRDDVVEERKVPLHGDFHLDQLVAAPAGPVLVDLDSMVGGAPEVDLAEFLVDLALRRLPGEVSEAVATGLLSSYTAGGGARPDPALVEVCAGAEFVNRCYRHLRRHTPGWQQELEAEVGRYADVARLLGGGTSLNAG